MQGVKPVVLVGFMGCGKTTVGRALASRLGWDFVDLDDFLVAKFGPIVEQFSTEGESAFREREARVLAEVTAQNLVVATGGGAFVQPGAVVALSTATTVFIDVPFAVIERRLEGDGTRPLWNANALELFEERYPLYRRATHVVDGDAAIDRVVEWIVGVL